MQQRRHKTDFPLLRQVCTHTPAETKRACAEAKKYDGKSLRSLSCYFCAVVRQDHLRHRLALRTKKMARQIAGK